MRPLAIVATHPIQYQAPVWEEVRQLGVPTHLIYGSDFSVVGYRDEEFGTAFSWDVNLVPEPSVCTFLSRADARGARDVSSVRAAGIGSVLDRLAPGAVLLSGYGCRFHIDSFRAALFRRIPIMFRAETTDHARTRSALSSALRFIFLRALYSRFDRLLPIGVKSYAHYRSLGCPGDKLVFSPYCVDIRPFQADGRYREAFRSSVRRELGLDETDMVLLFCGKLSQRKGVHLLAPALRLLNEDLRNKVAVLFVGDGMEREELAAACQGHPAVRARFIGFKNQRELSPYYHASDAFVLPSIAGETWGLVVNEALHHGLPCAVSDAVGCAPDLIENGETGYCCAAGDAEELAIAIEKTLALSQTEGCSDRCRAKVSGYSVTAAAKGIARAFHETVRAS
ncbi:MAG: glycosyltransferase family 4 protein [Acidobacteriaceae bacterium]|nr:glycosyltransferase family 4 protein [Acidobacteriaceae bacterium]